MKHDIQVTGYAFGLRPVTLADAELIVGLRTGSDRSRFLNPIPPSIEQQQVWLQRYFDRGGDYYFVIIRQRDGYPEGLIGLYDVDTVRKRAEWGRWIARPGSLASIESAMRIYELGFERFGLVEVYCQTLAANAAVVSFHDSCGLSRVAVLKAHVNQSDGPHDAVKHLCTKENWASVRNRLELQARMIAQRIERSL